MTEPHWRRDKAPVGRPDMAFVLPSFAGSGAERVLLNLLTGVLDRGANARLIAFTPDGPLRPQVPDASAPIILHRPRLRSAIVPLVRTLRQLRPGAVFSTLGYVNLALAAARPWLHRDTRLVLREANLPSLSLPNTPWPVAFRLGYRRLYPRADLVLATSDRMAQEFRRDFGLSAERLAILPNPVDVGTIRSAAASSVRHPGPGLRFVAVGRLVHQKGFDRLIPTMGQLPETTHLTILGDGPDREALAGLVAEADLAERITFAGYRADAPRFLAGADALLLPSRWEGMPNAALEALACGTPVIATPEAGGLAEVAAETNGGAVVLAKAGDVFAATAASMSPRADAGLRASLLPGRYDRAAVVDAFLRMVAGDGR